MTLLLALNAQYLGKVGLSSRDIRGVICIGGFYGDDIINLPGVASMTNQPNALIATRFVNAQGPPLLIVASRDEDISNNAGISDLKHIIEMQGGTIKILNYHDLGRIGLMLPFSPLFHNRSTIVSDVVDFIAHPP